MTALPVRAPILPSFAGYGRVFVFFKMFFEVIADAQRQASAAHNRYPFAEW
jgi:hypothetical protein